MKRQTLEAIIDNKVVTDQIVYSDTTGSYNVLNVSSFTRFRIKHSKLLAE